MNMNKRGAYFFVIDALIASSIIFISLIIIFSTHTIRTETNPSLRLINEFTDYLINTDVREVSGNYIAELIENKTVINPDNSLLQQMTEFYYFKENIILKDFVGEISSGIIPDHRSFAIYINDSLIFNHSLIPENKANLMLSSKKISFNRINQSVIYGPVIFEVKLWI